MLSLENTASDFVMSGKKALEKVEERLQNVVRGKAHMYKLIFIDYSMP